MYIEVPKYLKGKDGFVCKLKKVIHGLKEAPSIWNQTINKLLITLNFNQLESASCFYVSRSRREECYVVLYVDDIQIVGNSETCLKQLIEVLSMKFGIHDLSNISKFLGMNVNYNLQEGRITIDQKDMIDRIASKFQVTDCKPVWSPMENRLQIVKLSTDTKTTRPCQVAYFT